MIWTNYLDLLQSHEQLSYNYVISPQALKNRKSLLVKHNIQSTWQRVGSLWSFYYILFIGTLKSQPVPKFNFTVRYLIFRRNVMNL